MHDSQPEENNTRYTYESVKMFSSSTSLGGWAHWKQRQRTSSQELIGPITRSDKRRENAFMTFSRILDHTRSD